jgi:chromosomal replication initiation ATPase DnaA
LKEQQVPVTEIFYPESKAWLIHEYQFFMGKKESQQTFVKTLDFLHQLSP